MKPKAIFFDRDGIINERILDGYIRTWDEFHFLLGVGDVLKKIKDRGYLAIIITNQRGVGLGLMTESDLEDIHDKMQKALMRYTNMKFDDIIVCTDANNESGRRKPSPAMLMEAQTKYDIDMSQSWMIGDTASDITAGERAGVKTAFLLNKHDAIPENATINIATLKDILLYI